MRRVALKIACVYALAAAALLASAVPALAHEERKVGDYTFVVGWGDEPVYTGFKNSVQMILTNAGNGKPVLDLEGDVEVEVGFGDTTTTMAMEPDFLPGVFGEPGDYRAWLTPTRSGEYAFHFTGNVAGQDIDETFTCGEETFDCPADVQDIQFPAQDPSTAELSGRIDRELPRIEGQAAAADDQAASAEDDAGLATTLGYVGIGLGAAALIVSLVALARGRKAAG